MNSGTSLYDKAKKIIPGGTQLLSKRPEMFLPDLWPAYHDKAEGCKVWDLDGNEYIDMSYMGIGACILGYADEDINGAVKESIDKGNMSTLNCPEEVELAELLCGLHPWAGMVRYARTGGEAMSIAVRIARAKTGKDLVLFCGYHGWQDWYLSANLADDGALYGHLLPGLEPNTLIPKFAQSFTISKSSFFTVVATIKSSKFFAAFTLFITCSRTIFPSIFFRTFPGSLIEAVLA
ncbi:Glutamate-1-semialdehyde 2,1-aminomutase [subsurface metagenome]